MNKKQLYVAPTLEVSEYLVDSLILAASGGGSAGGNSGSTGGPTQVGNGDASKIVTDPTQEVGNKNTGLAKQMTTVFAME